MSVKKSNVLISFWRIVMKVGLSLIFWIGESIFWFLEKFLV